MPLFRNPLSGLYSAQRKKLAPRRFNPAHELAGGLVAGMAAILFNVAFGVMAFAPLGPDYRAVGAMAGMLTGVFAGGAAALFGSGAANITGLTASPAVIVATVFAGFVASPVAGFSTPEDMLFLMALIVLAAGVIQLITGMAGLGRYVQYLPYPVIAGFMNAVAIVIILSQLRPMAALDSTASVADVLSGAARVDFRAVAVCIITVLSQIVVERRWPRSPSLLIALVVGIGSFYLFWGFSPPTDPRYIVSAVPHGIPEPVYLKRLMAEFTDISWLRLGLVILGPAFTLGLLGAVKSLMSVMVIETHTQIATDPSRVLRGQGMGNVASALMGGGPASVDMARTMLNLKAGARTNISSLIHALFLLLALYFFGPVVRYLPLSVLAGLLLLVALRLFDTWSVGLLSKRSTMGEVVTIFVVVATTLIFNLVIAVGVGLIITFIWFIRIQISREVTLARYKGGEITSRRIRTPKALAVLKKSADMVRVYILGEHLFFGTAESFRRSVMADLDGCRHLILDFRNIGTVDMTGGYILKNIIREAEERGIAVHLSHLDKPGDKLRTYTFRLLRETGVLTGVGPRRIHPDLDRALEAVENEIIVSAGLELIHEKALELKEIPILHGLSDEGLKILESYGTAREFAAGEIIIEEGEVTAGMHLILEGLVEVLVTTGDGSRPVRVANLGAGSFFGEMSLMDPHPRSATVAAKTRVRSFEIDREGWLRLVMEKPEVSTHIMSGLSRDLANRLRHTLDELRFLEK